MVDKVIITPGEVRAYGDVVDVKSATDFTTYDSVLTLTSGVYSLVYLGGGITLTVSSSTVASGNTVTITATVVDDDGDPVEGATVELFKEV